MQMRIACGGVLSEFLVFSPLECLLQTTPPVCAPNFSMAKDLGLRDLGYWLADSRAIPESWGRMEGKRRWVERPFGLCG